VSWIAGSFPTIAFLALSAMTVYLIITWSKLGSGSKSAGPMVSTVQDVHGLESQAWAASSIAADLKWNPDHTLAMVRSYCQSVGVSDSEILGTPKSEVKALIDRLEQHLDLEPLTLDQHPPIGAQVLSPARPRVGQGSMQNPIPESNQDGAPDDSQ